MVAITVLATAVALAGVAAIVMPDRSGIEDLVASRSASARRVGLLIVALVLAAVLVAAAALSWLLRWLPGPRVVRGGLTAVLWTGAAACATAWLLLFVLTVVGAGLAERGARADSELVAIPGRVAAIPGVTVAGGARLAVADLASGHNLFVTAELDPDLTEQERVRALDRISAVLAEHQTNDLRMLAEARFGAVAVGVSADPRKNRYRLSLAEAVVAATGADLAVVTWPEQDDNLISDDATGVRVTVHSSTRPPARIAAAAARAVRARTGDGTVIARRSPPGARPPTYYDSTPTPTAAGTEVRVEVRPAG